MMDWMARARAKIVKKHPLSTAKTDETPLSADLSVVPRAVGANQATLSTVSSVGDAPSFENRILALDLIEAAMKVCDFYGDNEAARQDMRLQCVALSPRLQVDRLEHFLSSGREERDFGVPDSDVTDRRASLERHERPDP